MKKYIIKEALVPVTQVTLDSTIIDCVDSINFRIDGNRITNKVSSIHFKVCKKSLDVMERLMVVFKIPAKHIIYNKSGFPTNLDLYLMHIHLVKENVLELRVEQVVLEES